MQVLKEILKKENTTVYIPCMLDMYAFIRPNEIRFLRLKDIDLKEGLIYIDKSLMLRRLGKKSNFAK